MTDPTPVREHGWIHQRIVIPIIAQMRQGISADQIALTIALGAVLAVFPILGTTTALCALVALRLRLNQPVIQLVNYLCYPLQFALLIPFYRAGESLFGRQHVSLSIPMLFERLRASVPRFLADFGVVAIGGVTVWLLTAPLAALALFYALRPALRALERRARA